MDFIMMFIAIAIWVVFGGLSKSSRDANGNFRKGRRK